MTTPPKLPEKSGRYFNVALVAMFFLVALVGVLHHEMWRDELHAWMLARDSQSFSELYFNLKTEGHPVVWHFILFALSRASSDPLLMQLFHVCVATSSVYVVARFSPFSRLQKCMLAFGYFNLYEYALISRSYALGVLLVFVFCALVSWLCRRENIKHQSAEIAPYLILALLANTSIYGLFISMALLLYLLWPLPQIRETPRLLLRCVGTGVVLIAWLLCFLQVSRINQNQGAQTYAFDGLLASGGYDFLALATRAATTLIEIWRSYVPIPVFFSGHVWNTNLLMDVDVFTLIAGQDILEVLALLLSMLLFGWTCYLLKNQLRLLVVYVAGTILLLSFSFIFFEGSMRHHGHLFVLLVACLWLARLEMVQPSAVSANADKQGRNVSLVKVSQSKRQSAFLTTLLVFQVAAGVILYGLELIKPFSGSEGAAQFIRQHDLDDLSILGYRDREASTVSAYLDRPIYYPNAKRFGTFWTTQPDEDWTHIVDDIRAFVLEHGEPAVIVLTKPLELQIADTKLELLTYIEGSLVREESFYVYLATFR